MTRRILALCSVLALATAVSTGVRAQDVQEGATGTAASALEMLANGDLVGVSERVTEKYPSGFDVRVRFEDVGPAERWVYGTAGAAELSAALLLRGNAKASQEVARTAQEIGSRTVRTPVPTSRLTGRGSRLLRRLGLPGRVASLVANLSALRGLVRGERLAQLGRKLGAFGKLGTRQILYAHGTYGTLVSATGKKMRFEIVLPSDVVEEPPSIAPQTEEAAAQESAGAEDEPLTVEETTATDVTEAEVEPTIAAEVTAAAEEAAVEETAPEPDPVPLEGLVTADELAAIGASVSFSSGIEALSETLDPADDPPEPGVHAFEVVEELVELCRRDGGGCQP